MGLARIMFRARDAVKFGASSVCPKCNSGTALRGVLWAGQGVRSDVGIRKAQRRTGKIRADVWPRARPAGGVTRPFDKRAGTGGPAWRLLHQPAQSDGARDGPAHHQSRAGARQGIGAIGDGRAAPVQAETAELISRSYSGCKKGFKWRSFPMVVTGPWPG